MEAVTGVFGSRFDAERALREIRSTGVSGKEVTLLTPENLNQAAQSVPTDAGEQPGMGKAIGAVLGGSAGLSGGALIIAAMVPGVGPVTAVGLLGGLILGAAGASVGAIAGEKLDN